MARAISKKIYSQLVSDKGREVIEIIVHSAFGIPKVKGKTPKVLVTGQALKCIDMEDFSAKPNTTKPIQSFTPEWNDIIFIETLEEYAQDEDLLLLVIDAETGDQIVEYKLPWSSFKPFYQHNFSLEAENPNKKSDTRLYVSMTRKQSHFSKRELPFYGLEMYLNRIEDKLTDDTSLYAVARLVPDYPSYLESELKIGESIIEFEPIIFPLKHKDKVFAINEYEKEGYPKLVMACAKGSEPTWQQSFLFSSTEENKSLFTRDVALVIEFFPYEKDYGRDKFEIKNLSGWCAIRLDQRCKKSLEGAEFGVKTESLMIEGDGSLASRFSKNISAEVGLKLVLNKCPKKMTFDLSNLSPLNSHYTEENAHIGVDPVYLQKQGFVKKLGIMAEHVEETIQHPTYKNYNDPPSVATNDFTMFLAKSSKTSQAAKNLRGNPLFEVNDDFGDVPMDYRYALLNLNQPKNDDMTSWVNYYRNMSRLYRSMVKEMDNEITAYRTQIRSLRSEVASKMTGINEKKAALMKLAEINEVDRSNLNKAFLELRTRLAVKTSENTTLRDHIAVLERKLERKTNTDRELDKMVVAHSNQNKELQLMQERLNKAYGLEDTVKRQDVVIEKLENMIHKLVNQDKEKSAEYYEYVKLRGDIGHRNPYDD